MATRDVQHGGVRWYKVRPALYPRRGRFVAMKKSGNGHVAYRLSADHTMRSSNLGVISLSQRLSLPCAVIITSRWRFACPQ